MIDRNFQHFDGVKQCRGNMSHRLEQGANPDIQRNENILPVLPAVCSNLECVELMLAAGADPNRASDHNKETALHYAAFGDNQKLLRLLLKLRLLPRSQGGVLPGSRPTRTFPLLLARPSL